jgi:ArsR family transcriptional regulator, arsenate/arsenite/antimonite-responsive transcriptional repressor
LENNSDFYNFDGYRNDNEDMMEEVTKIFKALTDKNRLRILKMLEQKALCVCEITSVLDISVSTVSSHLSILKDAGFITDSKDGKWVEYKLKRSSDNPVLHQILAMMTGWMNNEPAIKKDIESVKDANRDKLCSS